MIAIIASRAFYDLPGIEICDSEFIRTPFGDPSDALTTVRFQQGTPFKVLARNGGQGRMLPDDIPYLANIWALQQHGVQKIIGLSSVAAFQTSTPLGSFVVPNQLIDYTRGRQASFIGQLEHTPCVLSDFSVPFHEPLRQSLVQQLERSKIRPTSEGVYGCLSGPRRETFAEAKKYQRDGCDFLGFTVMPEAILSQELALAYVSLGLVTRHALQPSASADSQADRAVHQEIQTGLQNWLSHGLI